MKTSIEGTAKGARTHSEVKWSIVGDDERKAERKQFVRGVPGQRPRL